VLVIALLPDRPTRTHGAAARRGRGGRRVGRRVRGRARGDRGGAVRGVETGRRAQQERQAAEKTVPWSITRRWVRPGVTERDTTARARSPVQGWVAELGTR